jgi:hypothetical protein
LGLASNVSVITVLEWQSYCRSRAACPESFHHCQRIALITLDINYKIDCNVL